MASEAIVADHPILSEQVKEEMHEEVKTSEEVENPKTHDSSPTAAMPMAKSEDKIEAKPIETPIVKELKKTVEEEKPKAEELVTSVAPLAEAEDKVEDKKIEPSVLEEEKKTVDEEKPIAAVPPTLEKTLMSEDSSSLAVDLAKLEENFEVEPPVNDVKQGIEEVQVSTPAVESELKVEDTNIEPPVVKEVKITNEPLVGEEKIATETPVVKEPQFVAEHPVVEKNIVVEPPVVEEKLVQTQLVEEAKDTMEQLVVEENIATETPVVEDAKIATETPLPEGKIVIEDSVVEKKIVETTVVEEAKNKTETPMIELKNEIESPVVTEEKDIIVPTLAEEVKNITEPSVIEEVKHATEPPVLEVKNSDDTPVVVASVEDKSLVAQECTAEPDTPDVMEPEAKIVESQLVTETSELPEVEEKKAESIEEKQIEQPKTKGIAESSREAVDKKEEQAADLPVESEPASIKEALKTLTDVVEKPHEYIEVETKKSVEESADKVEDIKLSKEEESTGKASPETTSLVEAILPVKEGQADAKEVISGVKADLVEELPKEEAVTENIAKDVKTDWAKPETKEDEEVVKSISTPVAAENILEGVITTKDAELVTENEKEDKKSETVSPVETYSNGTMEDKTSEKPDDTEQEKPEVKVKGEDTVPSDGTKELDDKLTSRDLPKEVVTIKSTQKQSTILSKVKNTLVKAKKAITGKSTNTKTPSSEPKGEIKV